VNRIPTDPHPHNELLAFAAGRARDGAPLVARHHGVRAPRRRRPRVPRRLPRLPRPRPPQGRLDCGGGCSCRARGAAAEAGSPVAAGLPLRGRSRGLRGHRGGVRRAPRARGLAPAEHAVARRGGGLPRRPRRRAWSGRVDRRRVADRRAPRTPPRVLARDSAGCPALLRLGGGPRHRRHAALPRRRCRRRRSARLAATGIRRGH